ncbi:MAG: LamG-like jellyroll fold domain-containing protein [Patescibacteria group bacterium]
MIFIERKRRSKIFRFLSIFFVSIVCLPLSAFFYNIIFASSSSATIYVPSTITDTKILADSSISSEYISDTITMSAAPGEFEPATFVIHANETITGLNVTSTDLIGDNGTIASSSLDIRVVKIWYQAGYTLYDSVNKHLTPELLVKNDDLIKTENSQNYALVDGSYVLISNASGISGVADQWHMLPSEFHIEDTSELQPIDITSNTNKQIWITVEVPTTTTAGTYNGQIQLTSNVFTKNLTFNLTVLPITLDSPSLTYSFYYASRLHVSGYSEISGDWKNTAQFTAELQNLYNHGITTPLYYAQYQAAPNDGSLDDALTIANSVGMDTSTLFYVGCSLAGYATNALTQAAVTSTINTATTTLGGDVNVYCYGYDEQEISATTRAQIEAVHDVGGKVIDAQANYSMAERAADILDIAIVYGVLRPDLAATYHSYGNKIYSYADPQGGEERPEKYRRNYGLMLWQAGYDGAADWAYQAYHGNIWDDFDYVTRKDGAFTYPTTDGVIDTVQWEGFREGVDDVKYLTTLNNLIAQAKIDGVKSTVSAENYVRKLREKDLKNENLDTIRAEMKNYILYFLDEGSAPEYDAYCGNGVKETGEVCDDNDTGNSVCADYSYTGGTLGCRDDCLSVDTSLCTPARLSIAFASSTEYNSSYINRSWTLLNMTISPTGDSSMFITWGDNKPIGYWKFDETSGTSVSDSIAGHTGTFDHGDYGTADAGTTESVIKETSYIVLSTNNDFYNNWIFEATSGAADGSTTTISDYTATSETDKTITLTSALTGFATGDSFHIYKNTTLPQWATGKFGNALLFDGIDDFVSLTGPSSTDMTGDDLTVEAWIKPTSVDSDYNITFIANFPQYQMYLKSDYTDLGENDIRAEAAAQLCMNNTDWPIVSSTSYISTTTWNHLAVTYDGATIKFYFNGILEDSVSQTGNICDYYDGYSQLGRWTNGAYPSSNAYAYYKGLLDEVKVWKRALSQDEIRASYNASVYSNPSILFSELTEGDNEYTVYLRDTSGTNASTTRAANVAPTSTNANFDLTTRGFLTSFNVLPTSEWDWMNVTANLLTVNVSSTKSLTLGTAATNTIKITPSVGEITLAFNDSDISNGYTDQWTASSTISTTTIDYVVAVSKNNTWYSIKVDGSHFNSYQSDSTGKITFTYNGGFSAKTFTVAEDIEGPSAFELSSPSDYSTLGNEQPTFIWNAVSDADFDHYELYVDNVLKDDNLTGVSKTVSSKIGNGNHTWYVKAVDKAGNKTQSTSTWTIAIISGGGGIIPPSSSSGSGNITEDLGGEVKKIFQSGATGVIKFLPQSIVGTAVLEIITLDPMEIIKNHPLRTNLNILGDIVSEIKAIVGGKEIEKINNEMKLSFTYNEELVKNSKIKKNAMKIYRWDETKKIWVPLKSDNTLANEITSKTKNFGLYGVFGESSATSTTSTLSTSTLEKDINLASSTILTSSTIQIVSSSLKTILGIPDNFSFERFLWRGAVGQDVKYLQIFLISMGEGIYPEGIVSGYFGNLTKKALIRLQEIYAEEILKPLKLKKGTGIFHIKTKAWTEKKINSAQGG